MRRLPSARLLLAACALLLIPGCFLRFAGGGGGSTDFKPPRRVESANVAVPEGYRVEVVATGLTYPTGVHASLQARVLIPGLHQEFLRRQAEELLLAALHDGPPTPSALTSSTSRPRESRP